MKLLLWVRFIARYAWEVVVSSTQVAVDVLSPRPRINPAFVRVPLRHASDAKLTLLSNLITFTPGTVFVDLSLDGKTCVIHTLYGGPGEENRRRLGRMVARLQDELDRLIS
jgi:multisubunit Na+/H+ antiporter MnhE subunit